MLVCTSAVQYRENEKKEIERLYGVVFSDWDVIYSSGRKLIGTVPKRFCCQYKEFTRVTIWASLIPPPPHLCGICPEKNKQVTNKKSHTWRHKSEESIAVNDIVDSQADNAMGEFVSRWEFGVYLNHRMDQCFKPLDFFET